jgi:hypothetical protein
VFGVPSDVLTLFVRQGMLVHSYYMLVLFLASTSVISNAFAQYGLRGTLKQKRHSLLGLLDDNNGDSEDGGSASLVVWRSVKSLLPPLITGGWKGDEGDLEPAGALYNLVFVRLVTLVCTAFYCRSLVSEGGGGFSLDFGSGPIEIPPLGVAIVVARILLPPL